jgi:hypothetical protein
VYSLVAVVFAALRLSASPTVEYAADHSPPLTFTKQRSSLAVRAGACGAGGQPIPSANANIKNVVFIAAY